MSDVQKVECGMRLSDNSGFVEFGAIVNGVFHPFAALRSGDYQEAQAAGHEAQAKAKTPTRKAS